MKREKLNKGLYVMCEESFLHALRRRAQIERIPVSRMVRKWLRDAMEQKHIEHASEVLPDGGVAR